MRWHSTFPSTLALVFLNSFIPFDRSMVHSTESCYIRPNEETFGLNSNLGAFLVSGRYPFEWMGWRFGWISACSLRHSFFMVSNSFRTLRGLRGSLDMRAKASNTRGLTMKPSEIPEITTKEPESKNKVKSRIMCIICNTPKKFWANIII